MVIDGINITFLFKIKRLFMAYFMFLYKFDNYHIKK